MIKHSINVAEEVPVHQKPHWVTYLKREVVKAEIQEKLEARPSTSPWASPVVLVDGTAWFCVDYRKLNQLAKLDAYPMLRIEEVLGSAIYVHHHATYLAKGYWQVPLSGTSKDKSVFTSPFGLYAQCPGHFPEDDQPCIARM